MSGHRWCFVPAALIVLFVSGCQSDGGARSLWNPFAKSSPAEREIEPRERMSLPRFARRKSDDETEPVKPTSLLASANVDVLLRDAEAALHANQLDEAKRIYEEVLSAEKDNATAHHGLAMAADLSQQWADAEYHYQQALRIRPRDANLLCDIGYSYVLQNRYSEASKYLNQALQENPQHDGALMNLALLDLKQGQRDTAEQRIVQRFGNSPAATQALASLETRALESGTAIQQASATISPDASIQEVRMLAARERELAEQQRAMQSTGRSQTDSAAAVPANSNSPASPITVPPQFPGREASTGALNVQAPPVWNPQIAAAGQPPAGFVPIYSELTTNAAMANATMSANQFPPAATNSATYRPGTNNAAFNASQSQSADHAALSHPQSALPTAQSATPNMASYPPYPTAQIPPAGADTGTLSAASGPIAVRSTGAFTNSGATGSSYGQPIGFSSSAQPAMTNGVPAATAVWSNAPSAAAAIQPAVISQPGVGNVVQLEGLNVGPGSLFPINSGSAPNAVLGNTGSSPATSSVNNPSAWPAAVSQPGMSPATSPPNLQMSTTIAPGTGSMVNGAMYAQPMSTLPSYDWALQQQAIQQQANRQSVNTPNMLPSGQQPAIGNPMEAYERERQKLDQQYHNSMRALNQQPLGPQMTTQPAGQIPTAKY